MPGPSGCRRDALIWPRDDDTVALVPCTTELGPEQLRRRLAGIAAVIGLVVAPREARQSLAAAEALRAIQASATRPSAEPAQADREPMLVDDHLLDLVLRADPALLDRLSGRLLAPLEKLPERRGNGWRSPCSPGWRTPVRGMLSREALHVHPQTVRYRMAQLRDAFGDGLEDPERRTALHRRAASPTGPGAGSPRADRWSTRCR